MSVSEIKISVRGGLVSESRNLITLATAHGNNNLENLYFPVFLSAVLMCRFL